MSARLNRYAKYRGYLSERTWANGQPRANNHLPILQIAELRQNAGLHNVVMTRRPVIHAVATQRAHQTKEEKISQLLDAQLFVEPGPELAERKFSDAISAFLQDGNWVAFTPWVRDVREVETVYHRPPVPEDTAPEAYLDRLLRGVVDEAGQVVAEGLFPPDARIEQDATIDHRFFLTYRRHPEEPVREARVEVFSEADEAGREEAVVLVVRSTETLFDGPVMENLSISQVFVPTRCTNLQPPAEYNASGAPYVFVKAVYRIDEIRRLRKNGTFNWLSEQDLDEIIVAARGQAGADAPPKDDEQLEAQKDTIEGRVHQVPEARYEEDIGHLPVDMLMCFDRWDVDGDGLSEDVYWIVAIQAKKLCEARLLTEKWPAIRPYRPLAEACAITVPGRYYGISLLELGEAIYDLVKGTFDIAWDSAALSNLPWFFYAASAQFRAEIVNLAPGEGYPLPGNPRDTVWFPNLATRDQTWAFNVIGLAMGFYDRLMSVGPVQAGQVPTGKSSAFRTFGTTAALLQQGDVRSDQYLLRFFGGLAQVALNFHRMNRKFLPPGKELRVVGWDGAAEQAYVRIDSLDDIDAEVLQFDFKPDFLHANPDALAAALERMLGVVATPLAFQLGIETPEKFYQAVRDYVKALRLDHKKYTERPGPAEVPLLAEEVIGLISRGEPPQGRPMEAPDKHLQALFEFINTDAIGTWSEMQVGMLRAWMSKVGQALQLAQTVQAAQAFQQQALQVGQGGVPTTVAEPPISPGTTAPAPRQDTGEAA